MQGDTVVSIVRGQREVVDFAVVNSWPRRPLIR